MNKLHEQVASLITEAKMKERLLADTLEVVEVKKKKASEEEREKVLDTAPDMLWISQKAGFKMVVVDNYPQLREMGINFLELITP